MKTPTPTRRASLYAVEAPKPWAELREEELERGSSTLHLLEGWARTYSLRSETPVLWLMPKKKAQEWALQRGDKSAEPVLWSRSKVFLREDAAPEDAEPDRLLAMIPPGPEPEELVKTPPKRLCAWSLEEALAKAPQVECLYLGDDAPLSAELGRLERLRLLYVNDSRTSQWPEELCDLAALESLSIANMPLSELPAGFARLHQLKVLHLLDTRLDGLPEVLCELPLLTELRVERPVLGTSGTSLELLTRMPVLRKFDVMGAGPRPTWLVPPRGFRESDPSTYCVTFMRRGASSPFERRNSR